MNAMRSKAILLSCLLWLCTLLQAQHNLQVHNSGVLMFDNATAQIDSIKFSNAAVSIHYAQGRTWTSGLSDIDSVTFAHTDDGEEETAADTVSIDLSRVVDIQWTGNSVQVTNPLSSDGVSVNVSGAHVVVRSTIDRADVVYRLSGTTSDGSLSVTSSRKLVLYFNGVSLTSTTGPAVQVMSDVRTAVHLAAGTVNRLVDGEGQSHKGALQSVGRIEIQGTAGTLQVTGRSKHGVQTSGSTKILGGTLQVLGAVKDAMNVDNFVMIEGQVSVTGDGDGIDADQGYIRISGGDITVNCPADGAKGLACDSTLRMTGGMLSIVMDGADAKGIKSGQGVYFGGGTQDITVTGIQSKGIKCASNMSIAGGSLRVIAGGTLELEVSGNGYDPSYCTGIKVDGALTVSGGDVTVLCDSTNAGGRAISVDGFSNITGGRLNLQSFGSCATYVNAAGATDSYSATAFKSNGSVAITGGVHNLSAQGRALSVDGNFTFGGDSLILSTNGNGFVIGTSGRNCTDGFAPACMKVDGHIVLQSGVLTATSTGKGGRGLVCDSTLTVGQLSADDALLQVKVFTSGAPVNVVSFGGGWGYSSDYWKGLPKGIKIQGDIVFNSGKVSVYCSQTSGDPTAEAIESKSALYIKGGEIEANSYDDAINAGTYLQISGGKVWAIGRGNDGIDCNGSRTDVTGGVVVCQGSETGFDANTDEGGTFTISGGTVVCIPGNMGAWDTPTMSGSQKYLSLSGASATNGFCVKNDSGDEVVVFKGTAVGSGNSGFQNVMTPKEGPGGGGHGSNVVTVTCPAITSGTYTLFTSVNISGGSHWHGLYSGASCTTSGNGTNVVAR